MDICAKFSTHESNEVKLIMKNEDGIVTNKTISFFNFKEAINECSNDYNYLRINLLPNCFYNGYFVAQKPLTGRLALFVPGQLQRMAYENGKDSGLVPYPSLMFFFTVKEGKIDKSTVFAVKESKLQDINDETPLYNYPYGNVSPFSGRICWGSNSLPKIKSFRELDTHVTLFINSPTNNDLFQPLSSVSKDITLISLIKKQMKRKTFDNGLLVSARKSIADFLLEKID